MPLRLRVTCDVDRNHVSWRSRRFLRLSPIIVFRRAATYLFPPPPPYFYFPCHMASSVVRIRVPTFDVVYEVFTMGGPAYRYAIADSRADLLVDLGGSLSWLARSRTWDGSRTHQARNCSDLWGSTGHPASHRGAAKHGICFASRPRSLKREQLPKRGLHVDHV